MEKLSLKLASSIGEDVKDYLMGLPGVKNVEINNNELFEIYIIYKKNILRPDYILSEIEIYNHGLVELISFNKHQNNVTKKTYSNAHICCEFCYLNLIRKLYEQDYVNSFNFSNESSNSLYEHNAEFSISFIDHENNVLDIINIYAENKNK